MQSLGCESGTSGADCSILRWWAALGVVRGEVSGRSWKKLCLQVLPLSLRRISNQALRSPGLPSLRGQQAALTWVAERQLLGHLRPGSLERGVSLPFFLLQTQGGLVEGADSSLEVGAGSCSSRNGVPVSLFMTP